MNNLLEILGITEAKLKVFFGTFIAVFIMVSLQYLGIRLPWGI